MCVCVCVCEREREGERERQADRQKEIGEMEEKKLTKFNTTCLKLIVKNRKKNNLIIKTKSN